MCRKAKTKMVFFQFSTLLKFPCLFVFCQNYIVRCISKIRNYLKWVFIQLSMLFNFLLFCVSNTFKIDQTSCKMLNYGYFFVRAHSSFFKNHYFVKQHIVGYWVNVNWVPIASYWSECLYSSKLEPGCPEQLSRCTKTVHLDALVYTIFKNNFLSQLFHTFVG